MNRTFVPPYPPKFNPGDIAIAKAEVHFPDGTVHMIGDRLEVTEATVSYYNVCHEDYDKEEEVEDELQP